MSVYKNKYERQFPKSQQFHKFFNDQVKFTSVTQEEHLLLKIFRKLKKIYIISRYNSTG